MQEPPSKYKMEQNLDMVTYNIPNATNPNG